MLLSSVKVKLQRPEDWQT